MDFVLQGFEVDTTGFLVLPPVPGDDLESGLEDTGFLVFLLPVADDDLESDGFEDTGFLVFLPPVPDDDGFESGFAADTTGFLSPVPDDDDVDEEPDLDWEGEPSKMSS